MEGFYSIFCFGLLFCFFKCFKISFFVINIYLKEVIEYLLLENKLIEYFEDKNWIGSGDLSKIVWSKCKENIFVVS